MAEAKVGVVITAEDKASQTLRKISREVNNLQPAFKSTAAAGVAAFSSISSAVSRSLENAREASTRLAQVGSIAVAGLAGIGYMGVKSAADLETMRQGFVTLLGSAEKADAAIAQIKKDAASTPFEIAGLVSANQLLTQVTKDSGRSEKLLLNVGKALAAAGKGQPALDAIISNLQQIGNTATISEMDVRQFGNQGVNILELLADYYGTTKEAAQEMVKSSKDAFVDLEGAFAKAGEGSGQFSRAFIEQSGTFNQLWSNMKDTVSITMADIVTKTGLFDTVKSSLARLIDYMNANADRFITTIKSIGAWARENQQYFPVIAGIIAGALAPAFIALAVAIGAAALALAPFMIAGGIIGGVIAFHTQIAALLATFDAKTGLISLFKQAWADVVSVFNESLRPALASLWAALQPLWPILSVIAQVAGGALVLALGGTILIIKSAVEAIILLVTWATKLATYITEVFVGVWDTVIDKISNVIVWIDKVIKKFERAIELGRDVGGKVSGAVSSAGSSVWDAGKSALGINDGIVQNGQIITTHPDDYIIATKTPGALGGGSKQITININGAVMTKDAARELGRIIMEDITRQMKPA